jgi:hypothetical protein
LFEALFVFLPLLLLGALRAFLLLFDALRAFRLLLDAWCVLRLAARSLPGCHFPSSGIRRDFVAIISTEPA